MLEQEQAEFENEEERVHHLDEDIRLEELHAAHTQYTQGRRSDTPIPGNTYVSQAKPTPPGDRVCYYAQKGMQCMHMQRNGSCPYSHDPEVINSSLFATLSRSCTGAGPLHLAAKRDSKNFSKSLPMDDQALNEFEATLVFLLRCVQEKKN